jgi:hypothetical protein
MLVPGLASDRAESLLQEIYTNPKTLAASYVDWMERKGKDLKYL